MYIWLMPECTGTHSNLRVNQARTAEPPVLLSWSHRVERQRGRLACGSPTVLEQYEYCCTPACTVHCSSSLTTVTVYPRIYHTRRGLTERAASAQAPYSTPIDTGICKCCICLLYTSPSPRDGLLSRMPSSA